MPINKVVSDLHIELSKKIIPLTLTIGEGENFEGIMNVIDKKAYRYNGFEREGNRYSRDE